MGSAPRHRVSLWLLVVASLAVVPAAQGQVVIPAEAAAVEGNVNNTYPFDCGLFDLSMRYQQVYLGSKVGSGEILELRFRQDGFSGLPFGPTTIASVTVQLSSTTADPFGPEGGLSLMFADNIGPDVTTVFSGDLVLSSAASGSVPRPFDIVVPLASRFAFDAGSGANLLLDVTIPDCPTTTLIDAQEAVDDGVARAGAFDAASPLADFRDTLGVVTQLIMLLIFEDGFESGDTSAWSVTVP